MDLRWPFYAPTSSSPPISLSDAEELTRQLVASNRERQQAMETSHGPLSGGNCSSIVTLVDPPRRRSSTPATLHAVPTSMVTANARVERIRRALKRIELALQYRERNPYLSSSTPKTTDDPDSSTAGQRSPPGLDGSVGSTAGLSALGSKSTDPSIPPVMARAGASTWSDAALQAITSPSADFQSVTSTGSTIFSSSAVPGEVCGQDVLSPFERIRVARLLGEIAVEVSAISIAHPAPSGIPQGSFSYGSPIRNASTRNLSETGHVESGQAVASLSESATTQVPRGGAVTAEPSTEVPTAAEPTTVAVTNVPSYLLPYVVAEANAATVPNLAAAASAAHLDRLVASQHLTPSTSRTSLGEPEERRLQAGRDPISTAEVGATEDRPLTHTHQRGVPPPTAAVVPPPHSVPDSMNSSISVPQSLGMKKALSYVSFIDPGATSPFLLAEAPEEHTSTCLPSNRFSSAFLLPRSTSASFMDSQIHTPLGSAEDAEVHRISSEELVYKVDHAQLTDFLHCLRAIQSTSFQEEEFMQMGLRFVVPGIRVFRAAFRGSGLEDSEATTTADQTLSVSSRCDGRVANLRPLSPYSGRTSRQNSINTKTLSPANSHSALDHRPARRCVLLHDMLPLFPGGEDMLVFMKQVALLQTLVTRAIWKVGLHIGQNLLELLPDHPDTEHAPTGE